MTAQKPFRFGVISEHMTTREAWVSLARRCEQLGYSTLLIRDHVVPDFFGNQFAPIAAMMSAADATSTLRVGTMVIDNDFRHPVILAKEAATIDLLSGGRLELGMGAGWLAAEYEQTGMSYDPAGVRIGGMIESIAIMKSLWSGESTTFQGEHYQISNHTAFPLPTQRPHPPILIGGGGKRILRFAGAHANMIGMLIASVGSGVVIDDPMQRTAAKVEERMNWIREGAGERFDQIEMSMMPSVVIASDRQQATSQFINDAGWNNTTLDQVMEMPSVLIGSRSEIAQQLYSAREQFGFSYIVIRDDRIDELAPLVAELAGR